MFSLTLVFFSCFLVPQCTSYFLNLRHSFVVSERLPRQDEDKWCAKRAENLNV